MIRHYSSVRRMLRAQLRDRFPIAFGIGSRMVHIVGGRQPTSLAFEVGVPWLQRISEVNSRLLATGKSETNEGTKHPAGRALKPLDSSWKTALLALGAEWSHRSLGDNKSISALEQYYPSQVDSTGQWTAPLPPPLEFAMKGYSLLYLAELAGDSVLWRAADQLADSLLQGYPKDEDGTLPYCPPGQELLVDSLGMICPFLARFARARSRADAMETAITQLSKFVLKNVDSESHLPYHGYYPQGAKRLGLHGWGRGCGWYMLGLVETLAELPHEHPSRPVLLAAFISAAETLRAYQREDGHWQWAVLHSREETDTSATSLVGYSMARGLQVGLLDETYMAVVSSALFALVQSTRADGVVDGSQGECEGMGKYSRCYGPSTWLQGSATAFAAVSLPLLKLYPRSLPENLTT